MLAELLQGVAGRKQMEAVEQAIADVPVLDAGGERLARQAAEHYRFLRSRGKTIRGTIDCLIATLAIDQRAPLLHNDRDYHPFEEHLGLQAAVTIPLP